MRKLVSEARLQPDSRELAVRSVSSAGRQSAKPRVSIMIATYNRSTAVSKVIVSVFQQTYSDGVGALVRPTRFFDSQSAWMTGA
jgi:cellulose synthase/poly-beta-1,6-N-acetylglucosamine synthase-like glycosyltransferase